MPWAHRRCVLYGGAIYQPGQECWHLSNSHSSCFCCNMEERTTSAVIEADKCPAYIKEACQMVTFPDSFVTRTGHMTQFCQKDSSESIFRELLGKIFLPDKRETWKTDSLAALVAFFFLIRLWCLQIRQLFWNHEVKNLGMQVKLSENAETDDGKWSHLWWHHWATAWNLEQNFLLLELFYHMELSEATSLLMVWGLSVQV